MGGLTAVRHIQEVLENYVLPIAEIIGQNFTLMHDGAPAHSMETRVYLESAGNQVVYWPACKHRHKLHRSPVGCTRSSYTESITATSHTAGPDRSIIGRMESHPPEYHPKAYQKHATQVCCCDMSHRTEQ